MTIPSYQDILALFLGNFRTVYGQSVDLEPSTSDYQWISVLALAIADAMSTAQLAYNNRSPVTAIGAALDTVVELNGVLRKNATASTCQVTLFGVVGTVISNGVVGDVNGNVWNLPTPVTIGSGGQLVVTATCNVIGAINALPNQITSILSGATAGWTSVNNTVPAVPGQPVETDAALRGRQSLSVALPSQTILAGTVAAIAAIPGVTRYNVLENFTNASDSFGNPPHSVTAVVEGGTDLAVATAIFNNRGIGPLTNGTTTVSITDPNTSITIPISFDRPAYAPIYVTVNAHLLTGGTSATLAAISSAILAYLNGLQIGAAVNWTSLIAAAMSVNPNPLQPIVRVETLFLGLAPSPGGTTDLTLLFNQVAQGLVANIVVNSI